MWFCTWIIGMLSVAQAEIDLDTASVDDFVALEHIDQAMAESIVAYRSGHDDSNVEALRVLIIGSCI